MGSSSIKNAFFHTYSYLNRNRYIFRDVILISIALIGFVYFYSLGPRARLYRSREFLVVDPKGDKMVIEVSPNRQGVINELKNLFKHNESKWIGGEIELFVNNFSFKPDTIEVYDSVDEHFQAVNYTTIKENRTHWKVLGTIYIWGNVTDIFPSLTREEVVGLVESGRDYILFYAVLVFTCVVGIIELLNPIERHSRRLFKGLFTGFLYFTLVIILIISISRCLTIYREIIEFEYSGSEKVTKNLWIHGTLRLLSV